MQTIDPIRPQALLPLEACRADHLAPFACLVVDELAEIGRRTGACFQSLGEQLLLHLGIGKHANNLRLQAIDDWPGVAAGAMKPYQPDATTLESPCSRKVIASG